MAPGNNPDDRRQLLHRELERKSRKEVVHLDPDCRPTEPSVRLAVVRNPPALSRGCKLVALAASPTRASGELVANHIIAYQYTL
eukprot:4657174-Pleurochrysis_carterae.AAC.1